MAEACALFIALDKRPFAALQGAGFTHLWKTLRPDLKIPAKFTVLERLNDIAEKLKQRVCEIFCQQRLLILSGD